MNLTTNQYKRFQICIYHINNEHVFKKRSHERSYFANFYTQLQNCTSHYTYLGKSSLTELTSNIL